MAEDFERRMRKIAAKIGDNAEHHVRAAALIADQVVVLATPVDTGRARANWITSIGAPDFSRSVQPSGPDQAAQQALAQGKTVINTWRLGAGSIFISNNVEYVQYLDKGSSAQAPEGMTDQAVLAARNYLRGVKLL